MRGGKQLGVRIYDNICFLPESGYKNQFFSSYSAMIVCIYDHIIHILDR